MKRMILLAATLAALTLVGYAFAGVVVSGDNGGTVTPGQPLTISVSDTLSGSAPSGPPYGWCDPSAYNVASGQFGVGLWGALTRFRL